MKLRLFAIITMTFAALSISAQKTEVDKFTKAEVSTSELMKFGYLTAQLEARKEVGHNAPDISIKCTLSSIDAFYFFASSRIFFLFEDGNSEELTNKSYVVSRKSGLFSSWKATTDISIPIETARKMSTVPIRSVRIQIGLANMSYKNEDFDVPQKQSKKNVAVADRFLNHIGL